MATKATLYGNSGGSGIAKTINLSTPFNSDVTTVTADDNVFWTKATIKPKSIKSTTVAATSCNAHSAVFNLGSGNTINKILSIEIYLIGKYQRNVVPYTSILAAYLFPADDGYIASGDTGFVITKVAAAYQKDTISIISDNKYAVTFSGSTLTVSRSSGSYAYQFYTGAAASYYVSVRYI